jgi:hypothetical protein
MRHIFFAKLKIRDATVRALPCVDVPKSNLLTLSFELIIKYGSVSKLAEYDAEGSGV